jgi:hypothetical protein
MLINKAEHIEVAQPNGGNGNHSKGSGQKPDTEVPV